MNRLLLSSIVYKLLKPLNSSLTKFNAINGNVLNDVLIKRHLVSMGIQRKCLTLDSTESHVTKELIKDNADVNQSAKEEQEIIEISDQCVQRLKKVIDNKEDMLRVEVFSGGCSGLQYKFDICQTSNADDRIFERDGVRVVVDRDSLEFIKGSTVDYNEELIKSSFRVINNPQSEQGCSCGASFAIKLDTGFKFKP